jgi:hypothetical protein
MVKLTLTGVGMAEQGPFAACVSPLSLLYNREMKHMTIGLNNSPVQVYTGADGMGVSWNTLYQAVSAEEEAVDMNDRLDKWQGEKRCATMAFHMCTQAYNRLIQLSNETIDDAGTIKRIDAVKETADGLTYLAIKMHDLLTIKKLIMLELHENWYTKGTIGEERFRYKPIGLGTSDRDPTLPICFPGIIKGKDDLKLLGDAIACDSTGKSIVPYYNESRLAFFTGIVHWLYGFTKFNSNAAADAALFYYIHGGHMTVADLTQLAARGSLAPRLGSLNITNPDSSGVTPAWAFITVMGTIMEFMDKYYYQQNIPNVCTVRASVVGVVGIPDVMGEKVNNWLSNVHVETGRSGTGLTFFPATNEPGAMFTFKPFRNTSVKKDETQIVPWMTGEENIIIGGEAILSREGYLITTEEALINKNFRWDIVVPEPTQLMRTSLMELGIGIFMKDHTLIDTVDEVIWSVGHLLHALCIGWRPDHETRWMILNSAVNKGQLNSAWSEIGVGKGDHLAREEISNTEAKFGPKKRRAKK